MEKKKAIMPDEYSEMDKDPFGEYRRASDPSMRERSYAWHTAIGLQAVDGLETSDYLRQHRTIGVCGVALNITITPASTLLKKLADAGITESVSGLGKGKYRFSPAFFRIG